MAPVGAIFFFARVIRAAIVGSLTRNARATSAVDSPHSSRSGKATWAPSSGCPARSSGSYSRRRARAARIDSRGPILSGEPVPAAAHALRPCVHHELSVSFCPQLFLVGGVVTSVSTVSFITETSQNFVDLPANSPQLLACFRSSTDTAKA
jgi:hypothetical protein